MEAQSANGFCQEVGQRTNEQHGGNPHDDYAWVHHFRTSDGQLWMA